MTGYLFCISSGVFFDGYQGGLLLLLILQMWFQQGGSPPPGFDQIRGLLAD